MMNTIMTTQKIRKYNTQTLTHKITNTQTLTHKITNTQTHIQNKKYYTNWSHINSKITYISEITHKRTPHPHTLTDRQTDWLTETNTNQEGETRATNALK